MIMHDSLPASKTYLKIGRFDEHTRGFLARIMIAFICHSGRMSASQAAAAVRADNRHRAQVCRFLKGSELTNSSKHYRALALSLINRERRPRGRWLFIIDKTCVSRQGTKTPNTFSTGSRKKKPKKGRRYNKRKHAPKRCHGFVMGLLVSPSGYRIPFHRCYYTREYCKQKGYNHHTEAELGALLVRELPVPDGAEVIVLGDTAYEAASVRQACDQRGFTWITPSNTERVIATEKPRPKVTSRLSDLTARQFSEIRFAPAEGKHVTYRRVSPCRIGPKAKPKTFYVHKERLHVLNVGQVQVVFSTKEKPKSGKRVERDKTKVLLTNDLKLSAAEIVELYDLRWQVELFFKELKSTLGFHQYGFRNFSAIESWTECCLITYLYLEWIRARRVTRRGATAESKRWWSQQRTHGLCQAVLEESELTELRLLADWSQTPGGLRKLKRIVRSARPSEYRIVK